MEPFFYRNPYAYYSPNRFRYNSYRNNTYYNHIQDKKSTTSQNPNIMDNDAKDATKSDIDLDTNTVRNASSPNNAKPIFEIFGIKLFFDDILLISLIFFLYTEGVKDQSLFISLILLLLS